MKDNVHWRRSDDWVGSEIEDSFVMVNIDSGKYVALNSTARVVWQALDQPQSEDQLTQQLMARFAVEEAHCRRSLVTLLGTMQSLNMAAQV